ncbi:MAG: Alpha/Beta hydrolase protein [Monoraphidium minutum]|nr:MAG: Alpha/Beta hydrolase protein [Monoraphidium minutum]
MDSMLNMVVPLGLRRARDLDMASATAVQRRNLLQLAYVTAPLLLVTAAHGVAAAFARVLGRPHPHAWTLPEELLITLMRTLLEYGDISVWRGFFRSVSRPISMPMDLVSQRVQRPGSRSLWFSLRRELQVVEPRAHVNILFIHGGAFISGSARQYQATYCWWLKKLARRGVSAKVLSVGYPLAPEHPYPAGRDACEEEIRWLMGRESGETAPVIVGGDSAGANLALSALSHMRDTGRLRRPPPGVLLVSPCVDLSPACVLCRDDEPGAGTHDYLPREKLSFGLPFFYAKDLTSPYVSPTLLDSLGGLAAKEVLLTSGGAELMLTDIRAFAKKLSAAASVPGSSFRATYHEEPGRVHSWPMLPLPHLKARQEFVFDFVERVLGLEPAGAAAAVSAAR